MRKISTIMLAAFLLLSLTNVFAQFTSEWVNPGATGNNINDIEFADLTSGVGIAITNGGSIVKTDDAGATWTACDVPTYDNFYDIFWISATKVVVVGVNGAYLASDDAGATWTQKNIGMKMTLRRVVFTSETKGFLVGDSHYIYTTEDGGDTWTMIETENMGWEAFSEKSANIKSIAFFDANNGVTVGDYSSTMITSDGGLTWEASEVDFNAQSTAVHFKDVCYVDADNVVAVGAAGMICISSDKGASFGDILYNGTEILNHVIASGSTVYTHSATKDGSYIYSSVDYGSTWEVASASPFYDATATNGYKFTQGQIYDVAFASETRVVVGGNAGSFCTTDKLELTQDVMTNWSEMSSSAFIGEAWIEAADFTADGMIGYLGVTGSKNLPKVYKTIDGGASWTALDTLNFVYGPGDTISAGNFGNKTLTDIDIFGTTGDTILVSGRQRTGYSTDGGMTWRNGTKYPDSTNVKNGMTSVDVFSTFVFDDGMTAITQAKGVILKTTNAGYDWQAITLPETILASGQPLHNCEIVEETGFGVMVGRQNIVMITNDGGDTWVDSTDAVKATEGINITKNLGRVAIDPGNQDNIVLTYNNSNILHSEDGGASWTLEGNRGNYGAFTIAFLEDGLVAVSGSNYLALSWDNGATLIPVAQSKDKSAQFKTMSLAGNTLWECGAANSVRSTAGLIKHTFTENTFVRPSQASAVTLEAQIDPSELTVNWTRGNGDGCAVFVQPLDSNDMSPEPFLFTNTMANASFSNAVTTIDGWRCVYTGTGSTTKIMDLNPGTQYSVFVAEYKGENTSLIYSLEGQGSTSPMFDYTAKVPTTQASNIVFAGQPDSTKLNISWTRGDGDSCAVFIALEDVSVAMRPILNQYRSYASSAVYGEGNWFSNYTCIYTGDAASVEVTGLPMDTLYTVFVAEFNVDGEYAYYDTTAAVDNSKTSPGYDPNASALSDVQSAVAISVYPNPTSGAVSLTINSKVSGMAVVSIYNIAGANVFAKAQSVVGGVNTFDYNLSGLSAGIYFVELEMNNSKSVSRLVVE